MRLKTLDVDLLVWIGPSPRTFVCLVRLKEKGGASSTDFETKSCFVWDRVRYDDGAQR